MFDEHFKKAIIEIKSESDLSLLKELQIEFSCDSIHDWFDYDKYVRATAQYDISHWYRALANRSVVIDFLENKWMSKKYEASEVSKVNLALRCISQTESLSTATKHSDQYQTRLNTIKELKLTDLVDRIASITLRKDKRSDDYMSTFRQFLNESIWIIDNKANLDNYNEDWLVLDKQKVFNFPLIDAVESKEFGSKYLDVKINLSASKKKLRQEFKMFVDKAQRKYADNQISKKMIVRTTLEGWSSDMILAYIDIYILMKLSGENLTNFQIGDLLFPHNLEIDPAEKIRRTVKPKALKMLSYDFLVFLRSEM